MANKIQFKRGLGNQIPELAYGEPGFVSDEEELYIGTENGNIKLTSKSEIENINTQLDNINTNLSIIGNTIVFDGSDTESLQKAIDKLNDFDTLYINKKLNITGININNKNNITIHGGILNLTTIGAYAFNFVGTCTNINIKNITIIGDGSVSSNQRGIMNNSGQIIDNVIIENVKIKNTCLGISFNADTGGSYTNSKVLNCHIENIVGADPGYGYGLHVANAENIEFAFNTIINCSRHSIYHAKGLNNKIHDNVIKDHRKDTNNNSYRPALAIYRNSSNLTAYNNKFIDCYDCCIHVMTDGAGQTENCYNVNIYNNEIINHKNVPAAVMIGSVDSIQDTGYNAYDITFKDNKIYNSLSSPLIIGRGKNIFIENNEIIVNNISARFHLITIDIRGTNIADNINIINNRLRPSGVDISKTRGIIFADKACTEAINIKISNNKFDNLYSPTGNKYIQFDYTVSLSNTLLDIETPCRVIYGTSSSKPNYFWNKGDRYININAMSGETYESLCIQSGNPGTWRILTTVGSV